MQVMWYKLYKPEAFYPVLLTQYASDVSEFNFLEITKCKSYNEVRAIIKTYSIGQLNKTVVKCKTRLANLIWEAKCFGFILEPAWLNSQPNDFTLDADGKTILLPLTSLSGVAAKTAEVIAASITAQPIESYEDLLSRQFEGKTVFGKKALEGFGLYEPTPAVIKKFEERIKKNVEKN